MQTNRLSFRWAVLLALLPAAAAVAQTTPGVGIGTTTPDASAALDISSTTKGLLLPRLSKAQRDALTASTTAPPVPGLVIYQTDNTPGLYAYDGTGWVRLAADNLGNHTATQNVGLNGNWLSNNPAYANGIRVLDNGNVGIGVSNPGAGLHISTGEKPSISTTNGVFISGGASGNPNIELRGFNAPTYIDFVNNLTTDYSSRILSSGTGLALYTGGGASPRMNIDLAGVLTFSTLAGGGNRMVTTDNGGNLLTAALPTDAQQLTKTGSTISLTNGGSVTDADNQALSISGSTISLTNGGTVTVPSSADNLGNHTATQNLNLADKLLVGNGGTSGLAIGSTGNVGLGTAPTSNKLDVAGNMNVTGNAAVSGGVDIGTTANEGTLQVTGAGYSAATLDQQQTVSNFGAGGPDFWQSFTAGTSGYLRQLDVQINAYPGAIGGTLSLYSGTGTGGTLLATQAIVINPVNNNTLQPYALNAQVPVVAGQVYTFRLQAATTIYESHTNTNPYAGGQLSFDPTWDMGFKTYVATTRTAVTSLKVTSAGNVGIGTSTPGTTLDVAGSTRLSSLAGTGSRMVTATADGTVGTAALPTDAQQLTKTGSTISLTNGGSVTDADNQALSISGSTISLTNGGTVTVPSSADNLGNHTATQNLNLADKLLVGNGGTSGLAIGSTGNVGLGTAPTSNKLDVAGNMNVTGNATVTGNAGVTGNATIGGNATIAGNAAVTGTSSLSGAVLVGTTATPAASAQLEVASTTKGFLPPRLTQTQRDAIGTLAAGLTVYNTTSSKPNFWNGTSWVEVLTTTEQPTQRAAVTFSATGAAQTYTVPVGVTSIIVTAKGAQGGSFPGVGTGGQGAQVQTTLTVTPGEALNVYVGVAGGFNTGGSGGGGGYNGGGNVTPGDVGGGGGGATDLRRAGTKLVVAGGGGGGGYLTSGSDGGGGGAPNGLSGAGTPGTGGTQTAGGTTGGSLGQGGSSQAGSSGAGGGGYYGGGGGGNPSGNNGGGGGGSSWVAPAGTSATTMMAATNAGNGSLVISYAPVYAAPALDGSNFVNVPGDNLGNHTATQALNLGTNPLVGNGGTAGLTVSGAGAVTTAGALSTGGNVSVSGTLTTTGGATVGGPASLNGGATVNGSLTVNGATTIASTTTMNAPFVANAGGTATGTVNLNATGTGTTTIGNSGATVALAGSAIGLTGPTTITGATAVSGNATVSGRLGIGISSPGHPLVVQADGSNRLLGFNDASGTDKYNFSRQAATTGSGATPGGLNLSESNVAAGRLFVQDGGNVGIGTTSPSQKLDVSGNANVSGLLTVSTATVNGTATVSGLLTASTATVSGNVGIGTTAPLTRLSLSQATSQSNTAGQNLGELSFVGYNRPNPSASIQALSKDYDDTGLLVFKTSPGGSGATERLRITADGSVGIGTTPAGGLHIDRPEVASTTALGVTLGGGSSGNPSLELRGANNALPYIDFAETSGADYTTRLISQAGRLQVFGAGTTGILMKVNGGLECTGLNNVSDGRLKQHIRPLTGGLAAVLALRGVRYDWNPLGVQRGGTAGAEQIGVIAQEVEQIFPELVNTGPDGFKSVNYVQLAPAFIEAFKEQQAQIEALRAQNAAAHAELQTVKAQATADKTQATATLETFEARLRRLEAGEGQARR